MEESGFYSSTAETSLMSDVDGTLSSGEISRSDTRDSNRVKWLSIGGACFVFMALMLIIAASLGSFSGDDDKGARFDGAGDGGESGGPVYSYSNRPTTSKSPEHVETTGAMEKHSDSTAPPPTTTSNTTANITMVMPKTTASTTTKKPLPPGSLLCTLKQGFKKATYAFPPDGLCTIIMFNSLYTTGGSTLQPPYNEDFLYFLETAKAAGITEFGIGIDRDTCSNETIMQEIVRNSSTKMRLEELWEQYHIYHYGQINSAFRPPNKTASSQVNLAAIGLGMFSSLIYDKKNDTHRPSYAILFHVMPYKTNGPFVVDVLRQHFVDVLVVVSYLADPDISVINCTVLPPTVLSGNYLVNSSSARYPVTLGSIQHSETDEPAWPSTIMRALSVGMGGRWYEPCTTADVTKFGDRCGWQCKKYKIKKTAQIVSIAEGCSNSKLNETFHSDTKYEALIGYDKNKNFVFTYDSPFNLRTKLCKAKANAISIPYALAAEDIQLDDLNGTCGYGSYSRLHILKKLSEFFAFNYTSATQEETCNKIT